MDHLEFGRYLAQQRELRGMTRDDVAAQTRIPAALLHALESGQAERLPEKIFVLNYIRAYAQTIGLSPEEAVLRYEEIGGGSGPHATPAELEKQRRGHAFKVLALVLIGLALLVGAFVWFNAPPQ